MNTKPTFIRHLLANLGRLSCVVPALFLLGYSTTSYATTPPELLIGITQSFLEQAASDYLQRSEILARHTVEIRQLDPRLRLPDCDQSLNATLESPAQPVGRVTVKIRCDGSSPWTVFVPGRVHIFRDVIIVKRPLKRQDVVSDNDVTLAERDIGLLGQGYLTTTEQALGRKLTRAIQVDQALTPAHLEQAEVIHKGDQIVITAKNAGINVRMQGEALSDGAIGEQIRVRNQRSKRVIKAQIVGPGQVEVAM